MNFDGNFTEDEMEQVFIEMEQFSRLVGDREGNFTVEAYAAYNPAFTEEWAVAFDQNLDGVIDGAEWVFAMTQRHAFELRGFYFESTGEFFTSNSVEFFAEAFGISEQNFRYLYATFGDQSYEEFEHATFSWEQFVQGSAEVATAEREFYTFQMDEEADLGFPVFNFSATSDMSLDEFRTMDANVDGLISEDEYVNFQIEWSFIENVLATEWMQAVVTSTAVEVFGDDAAYADIDASGFITEEEYFTYSALNQPFELEQNADGIADQDFFEQYYQMNFTETDLNGDLLVTSDELSQVLYGADDASEDYDFYEEESEDATTGEDSDATDEEESATTEEGDDATAENSTRDDPTTTGSEEDAIIVEEESTEGEDEASSAAFEGEYAALFGLNA